MVEKEPYYSILSSFWQCAKTGSSEVPWVGLRADVLAISMPQHAHLICQREEEVGDGAHRSFAFGWPGVSLVL